MRKHNRRLRSLPWITAVLAAVTSTSVATEQHDLQTRKKSCQEFLENRKFYGWEEKPDLLHSLQQFEGPGKIRFEYDPNDKWTMDFTIKDDWVWNDLTPGSEIRGDLVVDNANATYWIEKLGIIAAPRATVKSSGS